MNLIKIFIWFFAIFLNYAIFQANIVIGIVFLLIEIALFSRFKRGGNSRGFRSRSPKIIRQHITLDASNATSLVLELMKIEHSTTLPMHQPNEQHYHSDEHEKMRKAFER